MNRQRIEEEQRSNQVQQIEKGEIQYLRHIAVRIGDDHQPTADQPHYIGEIEDHVMAPSCCSSVVKPGKLVATGRISSMVTPFFDTSGATAKLIAIR